MTSGICKRGGGFFLASGNVGYYTSESKERIIPIPFEGTALNLALDTTRIGRLQSMLNEIGSLRGRSKPSKSSMGLMNEKSKKGR